MGPGPARPAGLPFGGIPPEYADRIRDLLADEEPIPVPEVEFEHPSPGRVDAEPRFGLVSFVRPHAATLAAAVGLVGVETLLAQVGPRLTGYGIDHGVVPGARQVLFAVAALYFLSIGLHAAVSASRISVTGRLGQRLMLGLRVRVFTHLQRLGLDFYTREKAGRILTRMTSDVEALQNLFQEGLVNLAVQGFTLLVMIGFMASMSPRLTAFLVGAIAPCMIVSTLWFRRASDRAYEAVRERIADLLADLQESLAGIRIIAMHNRQARNIGRHRSVAARNRDANLRAARIVASYDSSTSALAVLGQVVVLGVGGRMVLAGELGVGSLIAFLIYVPQFFAPIQQLVQLHNTYQSGQAAVKKLRDLLDERPNVLEHPDARPLPPIQGHIAFEAVEFAYRPGEPVLHGVDLEVRPGETLALVGPTGSGKSTIAKLVTRFYDPQRGRVCVDGRDVRDVSLASLRAQLGVVPQEAFLFGGTIGDNIAFAQGRRAAAGEPPSEATVEDERILAACRAVGIAEWIERLPRGLDTPCHERGVALSSGERQLIALARAFLAEPRVLVLDEATSNLDLATEALVERALDGLLEGRTAILIAHRLSTAMRADRIAVIDGGRLAELGSHAELLARDGLYARMFGTWSRQGLEPQGGPAPEESSGT